MSSIGSRKVTVPCRTLIGSSVSSRSTCTARDILPSPLVKMAQTRNINGSDGIERTILVLKLLTNVGLCVFDSTMTFSQSIKLTTTGI
jgi:hypothetical protein